MIEPPDIAIDELIRRVRAAFGVPVEGATFLPAGNDPAAWAFRLTG